MARNTIHPEVSDAEINASMPVEPGPLDYLVEAELELGIDYTFTFGKHKGEDLEDVIEDDPSYIQWMVDNNVRQFTPEVMQILHKKRIV